MQHELPSPLEAWHRIEERAQPLTPEEVDLDDALGQRAAVQVVARWDNPRADLSAMDGYACVGEILPGALLTEVAEVAAAPLAGTDAEAKPVEAGTAVAIMTGGWIPAGADRVVPFEATTGESASRVRIERPVEHGANIRRRGEVHHAGSTLIPAGSRLDSVHLAVAASEGHRRLQVVRRPRVGVLVTGDEVLADLDGQELPPGTLLDSHTPLVSGLCRSRGFPLRALGVAGDRADDLASRLDANDLDIVVTTGGVSAGRHDLVPDVASDLGFETVVHGVGVQPGKPILVAVRHRPDHAQQWLVGLPGNPAAVLVGFHLFVDPLLGALAGERDAWSALRINAELAAPVTPHRSRTRYLPAMVIAEGAKSQAVARTPVGSHDLGVYAGAQALLEVEPGERELAAGEVVQAIALLCQPRP